MAEPERRFLHALAELAFLRATALRSRDHFLAAAVYAYLYLLGEDELEPANPYDRRFRWACDLYNRSLRDAFSAPEKDRILLESGVHKLPVGSLDVTVDRSMFPLDDPNLRFVSADDYSVWGLSVRLRDSGLGAPLVIIRRASRGCAGPLPPHSTSRARSSAPNGGSPSSSTDSASLELPPPRAARGRGR